MLKPGFYKVCHIESGKLEVAEFHGPDCGYPSGGWTRTEDDYLYGVNEMKLLDENPIVLAHKKKCPSCNSEDVYIFDSDNDACKTCGQLFCA